MIRALVVDDHHLFAHSLALALGSEGITCEVAGLTGASELLAAAASSPPDLVLLDLDLGGALGSGADLVPGLVATGCRVLVVSATRDSSAIGAAVERGAVAVLDKTTPFAELLAAIHAVARGEDVLGAERRRAILAGVRQEREEQARTRAPFARLSRREAQVLGEISRGSSVSAIARAWTVSETTVRSQVRAVLSKLEVSSQREAMAMVHRTGWQPGE